MTPLGRSFAYGNLALSLAAWLVTSAGSVVLLMASTDELASLMQLAAVIGAVVQLVAIVIGSAPLVGGALAPLVAGAVLAAARTDDATVTAVAVGIIWFVGSELAWEAIERRDGVPRASSATRSRIRDVVTVIALTSVVAAVALVGNAAPPARSLPLQFLIGVIFFVAAIIAGRRLRQAT